MDITDLRAIFKRYKKTIVIGSILLLAITGLFIATAGFLTYKVVSVASDRITERNTEENRSQINLPDPGFMEAVVLNLASDWLEQGIASSDAQSVKEGLACFDTLGGPRPVDIVNYVKSRTSNQEVLARLTQLQEQLETSTDHGNGPAACASWILNS